MGPHRLIPTICNQRGTPAALTKYNAIVCLSDLQTSSDSNYNNKMALFTHMLLKA